MTCEPVKIAARRRLWRSSPFTFALSFLVPKPDRPYFRMWYCYLRWVDDHVDDSSRSAIVKQEFIARQRYLLQALYKNGTLPRLEKENEQLLAAVVAYDLGRNQLLYEPLADMLDAISFSFSHPGGIVEHEKLHHSYQCEVLSYLKSLAHFCHIDGNMRNLPGSQAALGAKYAHVLRDALSDLGDGSFKISDRDIAAFRIPVPIIDNTNSQALRRWVTRTAEEADILLREGLADVSRCASTRYRLLVAILASKYLAYLWRLRKRRFDLRSAQGASWLRFVSLLVHNVIGVIFGGGPSTTLAQPGKESLQSIMRRNTRKALIQICSLPPSNFAANLHFRRLLRHRSTTKMRRRFLFAYLLGRQSFRFVNGVSSRRSAVHLAGLLYGYWAVSIIELDTVIDKGAISNSSAQEICAAWVDAVSRALHELDPSLNISTYLGCEKSITASAEPFILLASEFSRQTSSYRTVVLGTKEPNSSFLSTTESFLSAQIRSREQAIISAEHDWKWYYRSILNQKTVGFFTAPLFLWQLDEAGERRLAKLIESVLLLNESYLHWQLLDDVADLWKDTRDGIVAAPGFVLISQAALARSWRAEREECDGRLIMRQIADSDLLCDWFAASPLFDRYRHLLETLHCDGGLSSVRTGLICSLSNTASDLSITLEELCERRIAQAREYVASMKSGNWDRAASYLIQSGAVSRIMTAVRNDVRRNEIRHKLSDVNDSSLVHVLTIIELLIQRAYKKATSVSSKEVKLGH